MGWPETLDLLRIHSQDLLLAIPGFPSTSAGWTREQRLGASIGSFALLGASQNNCA